MFAPKVAKAQTKAAENPTSKMATRISTLAGHRLGHDPVEQALFLQRTIGNQATLRLLAQQTSRQQGSATENTMTGETSRGASWDFSKIPLFPPDRQGSSPQPSIIQRKLVVGQTNDPLENEADRVADQVMRMPGPADAAPPAVTRALSQMHRKCSGGESCDKCSAEALDDEHKRVQRKPDIPEPTPEPSPQPTPPTGGGGTKTLTNCASGYLVESWGSDTCCTRVGFTDSSATNTKGKDCCNKFPKFVDDQAVNLGFDGAASCRYPKFLNHRARVTSKDKSTSVDVICVDTRADTEAHVIELGFNGAAKFKSGPLKERGQTVCIGDSEATTCAFETRCHSHPKEEDCLTPGCSKTAAETKPVQKKGATTADASGLAASPAPSIVHDVVGSAGRPLDAVTRAFFEPRFGRDLSHVRVHTDHEAGESARAIRARAYTVSNHIVFAPGEYGPGSSAITSLTAHELAHVMKQESTPRMIARRQPSEEENSKTPCASCKDDATPGTNGAIVCEYTAKRNLPSTDKRAPKIDLPFLVFPPGTIDTKQKPPKVDVFFFFHGMRATYGEESKEAGPQGSEPIGEMTRLKDAVVGTNRLAIVPQAPKTWSDDQKDWVTGQWGQALGLCPLDMLLQAALGWLAKNRKLPKIEAGDIHVAGHSAGGQGIIAATRTGAISDKIRDITLQDAGYSYGWENIMDWLLSEPPEKTVRVLISHGGGGTAKNPLKNKKDQIQTRAVLQQLNVDHLKAKIKEKHKGDDLEVVKVEVKKPAEQTPKSGGFILESEVQINNKKTGKTQATIVILFAPRGQHYPAAAVSMGPAAAKGPKATTDFLEEATPGKYRVVNNQTSFDPDAATPVFTDRDLSTPLLTDARKKTRLRLDRGTEVEVIAVEPGKAADRDDPETQPFLANVKLADGTTGWMLLANLAKE